MAEMTLQEAIDHAREVAVGQHPNIDGCSECAREHEQLANWLEELQTYRRIGAAPANVRENVRWRWIWNEHNGYYYCEKCGAVSPREDQEGEYIDCPSFCHNCGADIRGGRHNETNPV